MGIALFGQSLTFYIPHFLWKSCEGNKVERLVSGIILPVATEEMKKKHRDITWLLAPPPTQETVNHEKAMASEAEKMDIVDEDREERL